MIFLIVDNKIKIDVSNCNAKELIQITQSLHDKDIRIKRIS